MVQYRVNEQSCHAWQNPVIDKDLTVNPGSEPKGARYIVAATATGQWAGEENSIATAKVASPASAADWFFDSPVEGWQAPVLDEDTNYRFNGTAWVEVPVEDKYIKISADDTTAGYGEDKYVGTSGKITVTTINPGGNEQLQINKGSDIMDKVTDTLDDVNDGTSYGRVVASALESNEVKRMNDGVSTVTATEAKTAYDRRANFDADLCAVIFEI